MDRFYGEAQAVAVGTAKALINVFGALATMYSRGRIDEIIVGCSQTPADAATRFALTRTTAVGTEASGFTPVNVDSDGPAGQRDCGLGAFSAEPTKGSNVLLLPSNQRATQRWVAYPGTEILIPATQNYGACFQSLGSTVTTAHDACMYWKE